MRRVGLIGLLFIAWVVIGRAVAQETPAYEARDYVVSNATHVFAPDETTFTVSFTVTNQGGDAVGPSTISVTDEDGRSVIQGKDNTLPALAKGASQNFSFLFNSADFGPNSTQVFEIEAGIDQYELAGSPFARNNKAEVSISIPSIVRQPSQSGQSTPDPNSPNAGGVSLPNVQDILAPLLSWIPTGNVVVAGQSIPQNLLFAIAVALVAIVIWFLFVILRAIFRRPQKIGIWQPPYGTMPTMDPNSVAGRRQAWQSHAQNGTILAAPTEGNLHPIKLLLGPQGDFMKGWRITAMRLSQYDGYGRVGRTETIAPSGLVKRLNRILQNNSRYQGDALNKALRPVARAFVKQLRKNMTKRTVHLPVAMDIRFEGKQGEVHIAFELYQCQGQAWHRLDRWEPMMMVIGRRLIENYTYTIHGMSSGETTREFFVRLPEDVEWLLGETVRSRAMAAPDVLPAPQPTYEVPDTVSGMQPVVDRPR
jgi:hypothetical protein